MTSLVLIDSRVNSTFSSYVKETNKSLIFDYEQDTFQSLTDKINNLGVTAFENIALVTHGSFDTSYNMLKCEEHKLRDVTEEDLVDGSWKSWFDYWKSLSNTYSPKNIDFLACSLVSHDEWKLVLNKLEEHTGVNVRASDDETGNLKAGGDWVLETDNVNVKELYFNEDVDNWTGLFADYADYGIIFNGVFIWNGINSNPSSIRAYAFAGSTSLTSITIPSSVTSIGAGAFYGCTSLTSITIPNSVTFIGSNAFNNCTSLTSITIPNSVTSIGNKAFLRCTSLTSITIPSSVTSIGEGAFENCTSLTSITISSSVTSIGNYVFLGCTSLTSITIPSSVTSIGIHVFTGCTSLTSITIPSSVTTIESNAFNYCTGLTSIIIPSNVTTIGAGVFYNCTSLTVVLFFTLNTTTIQTNSFPSSVTNVFKFEDNLQDLTNYFPNAVITNILYIDSLFIYNNILYLAEQSITTLTIPDSVTTIEANAFNGCTGLTSITIPSSVTSIGEGAFKNCTSLTSITISSSVTSIGNYVFLGCTSLTSITIPDSVTTIGDSAFRNCTSLTSITIPSSVTSIGAGAFFGCTSLSVIKLMNPTVSIHVDSFIGCSAIEYVYSPFTPNDLTSFSYTKTGAANITYTNTLNIPGETYTIDVATGWQLTNVRYNSIVTDNSRSYIDYIYTYTNGDANYTEITDYNLIYGKCYWIKANTTTALTLEYT